MRTDAQLVLATRDGEADAFGELFDRYGDRIHTFCNSRLRNDADAADALQKTFLRAHWRIQQLDDPTKFRPWLFAIARNTAVDLARERGRHERRRDWGPVGGRRKSTDPQILDVAADQLGPDRAIAAEETAALLWDAAAALQPRDQELLELHLREGLNGSDLAAAMEVEPAHVYVMVRRMKTRLSTAVGSLLVARLGRLECDELDAILTDWDGTFSLAIRSTVTRHVESCEICRATRRAAIAWESAAAAMPAAPAPAAVRLAVMAAVSGGILDLTASGLLSKAIDDSPTGSNADPDADADADGGGAEVLVGSTSSGEGGRFGPLASIVLTTRGLFALAVVVAGAVLAWSVTTGDDPGSVTTSVAGIQETAPTTPATLTPTVTVTTTTDSGDSNELEQAAVIATGGATTDTTPTVVPTTAPPTPTPTRTGPPTPNVPSNTTATAPTATSTPPATTATAPTTTTTPPATPATTTTSPPTTTTSTPPATPPATTTTSPPTTTTTTTPGPPQFSGSVNPIVFPEGAASIDYTFTNSGGTPMSWTASTLAPFGLNATIGTLPAGASITLTILFNTGLPDGDYTGILDLNTSAGDVDITLAVNSPPSLTFGFSPNEIWEDAGACAGGLTGLPIFTFVEVNATDNSGVVSVVAFWDNANRSTNLTPSGTNVWSGTIGSFAGPSTDLVVVQATDDTGNVSSTIEALSINACPT